MGWHSAFNCGEIYAYDNSQRNLVWCEEDLSAGWECWRGLQCVEKIFTVKRSDKALAEYCRLFKAMWEELQIYHPLITELKTLKRQREESQTAVCLCGLGPEYALIKGEIIARETLPSLAVAYSLCTTADARTSKPLSLAYCSRPDGRGGCCGNCSSGSDDRSSVLKCTNCVNFDHSDHVCWNKSGKSACLQQVSSAHASQMRCTYCGKSGHNEDMCWDKLLKPVQANQAIGGRGIGLRCSYCGASGHAEVTCWSKMGKLGWAQQAAVGPGLGLRCSYCGLTGHAEVSCC